METQTGTQTGTQTAIKKAIKKSYTTILGVGILTLILGIIAIVYPESIGKVSVITLGVFIVIGGILRMVFAIFSASMGSYFMRLLFGIIMLAAGIWIISNPDMGLEALTMVIAIYFILDGITEIGYSFSLMPIGGGFYLLFSGIVSLIIGGLVFYHWPENSTYLLGTYIGIKLALDGLMIALTGGAIKKASEI